MSKKVLLVIFDGFGEARPGRGNAITRAKTPHLKKLRAHYPFNLLKASGEAVGVQKGVMGGSEIGHFTIGAGRIVPQFLVAINHDIKTGAFFRKKPLAQAFHYAKKRGKKVHLLGMISDKGVHSHLSHLFALLEGAKKRGLKRVFVHAIADGRDVPERSAKQYLRQILKKTHQLKTGRLATLIGRYYTMDRDTNWERTEKGYRLMTRGIGEYCADPLKAADYFYRDNPALGDQYMTPYLLDPEGLIETGDVVIYFNYRTDRTRQMTSAFVDPKFPHFRRAIGKVRLVCMGPYSRHAPVLYPIPVVKNNLTAWLSRHRVRQLRVAETEKYAHLTYFFNSQVEKPAPLEDRIHIHTPKIKTHDQKPELASHEITRAVARAMKQNKYPLIMVNYANADLVGHTGKLRPTIKAIQYLDEALGTLIKTVMQTGTTLLLTADHGNAEEMLFADGSPRPSHTTNPVIFLVADPEGKIKRVKNGGLADVAPTLLKLLDLPQPKEMTGGSLI